MHPHADNRIKAFEGFVAEMRKLCGMIHQAEGAMIHAKGDTTLHQSRLATAKLRFQIQMTPGRTIKRDALESAREAVLSAVGGEPKLESHPMRRLAEHYLSEIEAVRPWPPQPTTPEQDFLHLSEVMQVIDRALGEAGVMRRAPQADCKL